MTSTFGMRMHRSSRTTCSWSSVLGSGQLRRCWLLLGAPASSSARPSSSSLGRGFFEGGHTEPSSSRREGLTSFSTSSTAAATPSTDGADTAPTFPGASPHTRSRNSLGLGGHPFAKTEPYKYPQIVRSALEHGIETIEAPPSVAGESALASALKSLFEEEQEQRGTASSPIEILVRVGYETKKAFTLCEGDVVLERSQQQGGVSVGGAEEGEGAAADNNRDGDNTLVLVHNLTGTAIQRHLEQSPLALLAQSYRNVRIVPLLHNPEEQRRRNSDQSSSSLLLDSALATLESLVADGAVARYGVVSNGLCLPQEHPLHLPIDAVIDAAMSFGGYQITQLPANALETAGIRVARELAARITPKRPESWAPHQVYAMRPLACYPDRGAGTGHPFVLADLLIPEFTGTGSALKAPALSSSAAAHAPPPQLHWTNEMPDSPPPAYEQALKLSMQHFDADELVQAKLEGKALTGEQRETLDGCKLLQSLFHDLDAGLHKQRSLAAHDEYLYKTVIPLIHDTFESYDEDTAQVLERFFAAYTIAVRHAVAKNTRALLRGGEGAASTGGARAGAEAVASIPTSSVPAYDIPDEMRLQEFGLRFLLGEPAISKVIVGATEVDQVVENVGIVERWAAQSQQGPEPEE